MKTKQKQSAVAIVGFVVCQLLHGSLYARGGHTQPLPNRDVLTLAEAQQLCIHSNPSLSAIQETVQRARYQVKEAQSSYWPQLDVGAGAEQRQPSDRELDSSSLLGGTRDTTQQNYLVSLQATWVLFDGLQRGFSVKAARFGAEAAAAEFANAQRLLMELVAQTFFQAQLTQQRIRISQADLSFNQRLFGEAEAKLRAGTGSSSEEDNFEIRMNAALTSLIDGEKDYRLALATLASLLGMDQESLVDRYQLATLGETETDHPTLSHVTMLQDYAQTHRPDLQYSHLVVQQADAQVGQARSRYSPQLAVSGFLNGRRPNNAHFENQDFGSGGSLTLTYPLFDGWARRSRVHQARAQVRQLRSLKRQTQLDIQAEVQQAYLTLQAARERIPLQRENVTLTREVREREEKAYQAGQSSLVRLNEVQRDLIRAEATLALTQVELGLAWEKLYAATGKNLERMVEWQSTTDQ